MPRILQLLILATILPQSLDAQQKRIYLAPDDHTDYMWTGNEEEYRQAFVEMIDYYLDLADKTKGNAPEHQSRWHCDGSIWFSTYEQNKSPADFKRLIESVRDGHISLPLNTLVSTYGGRPLESVLRDMYYAGTLERRFGLKIPMAIAMEDQTMPFGLGSLWAGAGAKYSWKGICGCLTRLNKSRARPHDMYWWTGLDGSRLLMKWNTMHVGDSGARTMGGYAGQFSASTGIPGFPPTSSNQMTYRRQNAADCHSAAFSDIIRDPTLPTIPDLTQSPHLDPSSVTLRPLV